MSFLLQTLFFFFFFSLQNLKPFPVASSASPGQKKSGQLTYPGSSNLSNVPTKASGHNALL